MILTVTLVYDKDIPHHWAEHTQLGFKPGAVSKKSILAKHDIISLYWAGCPKTGLDLTVSVDQTTSIISGYNLLQ